MTPAAIRARAYAAQALMNDETLKAGLDEIEAEIITKWERAGPTWGAWFSHRRRERLWIELRTVKALRQKLASFAAQARD